MPSKTISLLLLFVALLGTSSARPKITGGEDAEPNSVPYIVSMQLELFGEYNHNCGGAIIDEV